jgi:HNH endonuclease
MEAALARLVRRRGRNRCEYCHMLREYDDAPFEIDHIISKKHHGLTVASNLALSCFHSNSFKGSDIGGRDLLTRKFTPFSILGATNGTGIFTGKAPISWAAQRLAASLSMSSISTIRYVSNCARN